MLPLTACASTTDTAPNSSSTSGDACAQIVDVLEASRTQTLDEWGSLREGKPHWQLKQIFENPSTPSQTKDLIEEIYDLGTRRSNSNSTIATYEELGRNQEAQELRGELPKLDAEIGELSTRIQATCPQ